MEYLNAFLVLPSIEESDYRILSDNLDLWLVRQLLEQGKFANAAKLIEIRSIDGIRYIYGDNYAPFLEIIRKYINKPMVQENVDSMYSFLIQFMKNFDSPFIDALIKIPDSSGISQTPSHGGIQGIDWERIKTELIRTQSFYPLTYLANNKIIKLTDEEATGLLVSDRLDFDDLEFLLANYNIPYEKVLEQYEGYFNREVVDGLEIIDRIKPITREDKATIFDNRAKEEYVNSSFFEYVLMQNLPADVLRRFIARFYDDPNFWLRSYNKYYPNHSKILVTEGKNTAWYLPIDDSVYDLPSVTRTTDEKIKILEDRVVKDLSEKYAPGASGMEKTQQEFEERCNLEPIALVRQRIIDRINNASIEKIELMLNRFRDQYDFAAETLEDKRATLREIVEQLDRRELCTL